MVTFYTKRKMLLAEGLSANRLNCFVGLRIGILGMVKFAHRIVLIKLFLQSNLQSLKQQQKGLKKTKNKAAKHLKSKSYPVLSLQFMLFSVC